MFFAITSINYSRTHKFEAEIYNITNLYPNLLKDEDENNFNGIEDPVAMPDYVYDYPEVLKLFRLTLH